MYRDKIKFVNRWRVTGTLRTESDFHLGDGGWAKLKERKSVGIDGVDADPDYATICRDSAGTPLIPATSLKGALRAWLEANGLHAEAAAVMGTEKRGGTIWVSDAPQSKAVEPKNAFRYWNAAHATCLAPSVVLDPVTRTAKNGLLYYTEFVPAGAEFTVEITGQTVKSGQAEPDACALLLQALAGAFEGQQCLGAGPCVAAGGARQSDARLSRRLPQQST